MFRLSQHLQLCDTVPAYRPFAYGEKLGGMDRRETFEARLRPLGASTVRTAIARPQKRDTDVWQCKVLVLRFAIMGARLRRV